jgi:hypothetical protein
LCFERADAKRVSIRIQPTAGPLELRWEDGVIFLAGPAEIIGNGLRGRQTFYLVQDQDTLAVQRGTRDTGCKGQGHGVTFAWQFKPVLGQRAVRDGLRQTSVQLSFDETTDDTPLSTQPNPVTIRTGWRRYDTKTGRVGEPIKKFVDVPEYTTLPYPSAPIPLGVAA